MLLCQGSSFGRDKVSLIYPAFPSPKFHHLNSQPLQYSTAPSLGESVFLGAHIKSHIKEFMVKGFSIRALENKIGLDFVNDVLLYTHRPHIGADSSFLGIVRIS